LPDFVDPPDAELVAGVDANGVEYVFEDDPYAEPLVDPAYDADDRNWVRYRPNWGGYARFAVVVVLLIAAVLWGRSRVYAWIDDQIDPGGEPGETVQLEIESGASTNDVASLLADEDVIANATVFRYYLRCDGDITITGFLGCNTERTFQAGDYELAENMAFDEVIAVLDEGPAAEVLVNVTVPEGLRIALTTDGESEFINRVIESNDRYNAEGFQEALASPDYRSKYLPEDMVQFYWYEGMLFPATYDVPEDAIADEAWLVQRMSQEFDSRMDGLLTEPRDPVIDELGLNDYQIVIIASMIEEEARIDEDRPKMARAIYNRLLNDDLLGIDATTYFAVGKSFGEQLTQEDLDNPSPWNTRAVAGLPPTPIGAPGEASLRAALQPEAGDFYYWVLTDPSGAHSFAATAEEHAANVAICVELELGCG